MTETFENSHPLEEFNGSDLLKKKLDDFNEFVTKIALEEHVFLDPSLTPHMKKWFEDKGLDCVIEESGKNSKFFNGELNPMYKGEDWYRGYFIKRSDEDNDGVVILNGWKIEGNVQPLTVLLLGSPNKDWTENIVGTFLDRATSQLHRVSEVNRDFQRRSRAHLN